MPPKPKTTKTTKYPTLDYKSLRRLEDEPGSDLHNNNEDQGLRLIMSDRPLASWEEKALAKGRRPLPRYPGDVPPIPAAPALSTQNDVVPIPTDASAASEDNRGGAERVPASAPAADTSTSGPSSSTAAATDAASTLPASNPTIGVSSTSTSTASASTTTGPGSAGGAVAAAVATPSTYRYWSIADLRRLIDLKGQGLTWTGIQVHFPDRTVESLRQTWHKRRGRVEAMIAREAAEAAAAAAGTAPVPTPTPTPTLAPGNGQSSAAGDAAAVAGTGQGGVASAADATPAQGTAPSGDAHTTGDSAVAGNAAASGETAATEGEETSGAEDEEGPADASQGDEVDGT
ncbi:hypothetical protein FALBO_5644 [Fusarium albosuccineum]|uniref:Myb-like domain-containing protein n=1 Tax=Fusarium albosuccineum TaxID=1237068 RepID=A0A8H4PKC5_9HYPO|nr:hypothetical protein FALBO_5644 [Fusarium albosuccineum]